MGDIKGLAPQNGRRAVRHETCTSAAEMEPLTSFAVRLGPFAEVQVCILCKYLDFLKRALLGQKAHYAELQERLCGKLWFGVS